ncbi:MAG: tetratricopeptide repeat protein [Pseudodesulfovibrio sp.]|nr:tetratricopeptide repeat protein [Pseudodesulfovibrio sp.]
MLKGKLKFLEMGIPVMAKRERNSKSLYVIKACGSELKDLEAKKKSETKNLYVVRTNDEIINKYCDVIYDFVDEPGVFILVTRDKAFYKVFKSTISHELGIELDYIQVVADLGRAAEVLQHFSEKGVVPFLFMEHALDSELTLSFLRYAKSTYRKMKVAILSRELSRERLFQFYEEGADSFLKKPACANSIIKKAAFMLKPQCEADSLVQEGQEHVCNNRFEEAVDLAEKVLLKWPKNAAAMVVLGDAKKGLAMRSEALSAYVRAERNSDNYLEPLKKIVLIHAEDDNQREALKYLVKLDRMSPLNCHRKIKIAEMHYDQGDAQSAEKYFDNAIGSAKEEAMAVVGEMSLDIAEMVASHDPELAVKYYRQSLEFVKNSKSQMAMNIYNRLGISLRKQGLWNEAVEAYGEAAKYSPKDENIQYNMGLALAEGGKHVESAQKMYQALCINPEMYAGNPDLAYNMGHAFAKAHKTREAVTCLMHLHEISPGFKDCEDLLRELKTNGLSMVTRVG